MMDTSKEYILMCKKAEEIQKLRPDGLQNGDMGEFGLAYYRGREQWNIVGYPNCVWLPRQDQLQEMVKDFVGNLEFVQKPKRGLLLKVEARLGIINTNHRICKYYEFPTFEQLWLAFMMKEKYNKTWNGKEWVK